jgi:hypothetical protein
VCRRGKGSNIIAGFFVDGGKSEAHQLRLVLALEGGDRLMEMTAPLPAAMDRRRGNSKSWRMTVRSMSRLAGRQKSGCRPAVPTKTNT